MCSNVLNDRNDQSPVAERNKSFVWHFQQPCPIFAPKTQTRVGPKNLTECARDVKRKKTKKITGITSSGQSQTHSIAFTNVARKNTTNITDTWYLKRRPNRFHDNTTVQGNITRDRQHKSLERRTFDGKLRGVHTASNNSVNKIQ